MTDRNHKYNIVRILLLMVVLSVALSGCGKKETPIEEVSKPEEIIPVIELTETEEAKKLEESSDVEETVSDDNSEEVVHVGNVSDFLEAIKPGVTIVWEPGYYNFSEYTDKIWSEQGDYWNEEHTYVKLEECFDGGVEVIIQNVDNLAIMGDLESAIPTEFVVETRYGEVLGFENCHQILLSGLTMGHTDEGTCMESVLSFSGSSDIQLSAMDLYGCGMYGFTAENGSGDIYLQSSTIRECSGGPFNIYGTKGSIEFRNCWLADSLSGGYFESNEDTELSFYECNFGQIESNMWLFRDDAICVDCIFEEATIYPDVEQEEEYEPDIESFEPITNLQDKEEQFANIYLAYVKVEQQSGEAEYYPNFLMQLSEDGTGYCETEYEHYDFVWYADTDGTLTLEGNQFFYLTPYIEKTDGQEKIWLMMQMNEDILWLY